MNDFPAKPKNVPADLYAVCLTVTSKRARTVINHLLKYGSITTEELSERYGYGHPPRAVRDVRENGIPVETFRVTSTKSGRQIAAYRFADYSQIIAGRVGGRKVFSKKFKAELLARYGRRSALTNEQLESRYLQIDHRIPYEIAGNVVGEGVEHFMLLDAAAQRAKSWSCENCENFRTMKDPSICQDCFWALPESYNHIAMRPERRIDIVWSGEEAIATFEAMKQEADKRNSSLQGLIKIAVSAFLARCE